MSIKVMSEVWEHAPFVGTDLLILLALADMANDDRECWPGLKHVAHKGRITVQQATSVLQNLELQGVIEIIHRTLPDRGNISNLYRIKPFTNWDLLTEYEQSNPTNAQHTPPTKAGHSSILKQGTPPSNTRKRKSGKEPVLETKLEPKGNTNTSDAPASGNKPKREPDLIFNAVALGHGMETVNGEGGRIGKISNWLKGKYDGKGEQKVGLITSPATVEHINAFFADWKKEHKGIDPPLDFVKFVEHWRKWAGSKRQGASSEKDRSSYWRPIDPATGKLRTDR